MQKFDLVVIGSGPGGYRAAVLGALRGLSVAIVEKDEWGGCCLNRGCVPKKAWYHSAQLMAAARRFSGRGIYGQLSVNLVEAWNHQKRVVQTVRESYTDYLKRLGVSAFQGTASFIDPHTIVVGQPSIQGNNIIIATGSHPYVPENLPLAPGRIITTDDLFDNPPPQGKRVAVIGSGVIGTEMAFILTMLGLEVVWLTYANPLSRTAFSQSALKTLYQSLERFGIRARIGSRVKAAQVVPDGVLLTLPDGGREKVDWVLLGSGRVPHTEGLNLEAPRVTTDSEGFIQISAYQQTAAQHIYAIGDVVNPAMTSNHALAEASVAVANIVEPGSARRSPRSVPELVYSAVELARVGMSEDQAEEADLESAVGFAAFEVNPGALGEDAAEGFVRLVADMDSGELLGAEVVGREASELIHLISLELDRERALKNFAGMFYNHPTRAEELLNATETLAVKWGLKEHVFGSEG